MSDRDPFIKAIIASPDDDVPRLIYADWLDENGQPERAEFIRVQREIAADRLPWSPETLKSDFPRRLWLRRRERELLGPRWNEWFGRHFSHVHCDNLGDKRTSEEVARIVYARGFVEEIACTWEDWCRHADAIRAATPLRKVRLTTRPVDALYEPFSGQWPGVEFELPPPRPALTLPAFADMVRTTVNDLGGLRATDAPAEFRALPNFSKLFCKGNVTFVSDWRLGLSWRHVAVSYQFAGDDFATIRSPRRVVDEVRARRMAAFVSLMRAIDAEFAARHPGADPSAFRLAVLRGTWLEETVHANAAENTVAVYIDAAFAFEPAQAPVTVPFGTVRPALAPDA